MTDTNNEWIEKAFMKFCLLSEIKSNYAYNKCFKKAIEDNLPKQPESECNCKGGRHCEVCRKADSCGAMIEKLNEVSPEVRDNINPDIVNLWDKLNEVIDRINNH